ncbi:MAG: hypothetical protein DMG81_02795 [Acidobacteria bacterium]|nr:MAG: hypothetical protein DMG81_02795 [Acidobacteriota bacterium]
MKILKRLFCSFALIVLLLPSLSTPMFAQATAAPPMVPRQQPGPGASAPGAAQAGRMRPTNMTANGGSMMNGVYSNSVYGFSLKAPPGWAVVPSKDPVPANEEAKNPMLKAAQISHTLLVMTENAPLRKPGERKSLQIMATRMLGEPTPTAAHDYLIYSQKHAKEKGMAVEYGGEPEEVTINGEKLWKIASTETVAGAVQHVEQYVIARQSILMQFFLVSPTEPGLKEIEPTIQSLQFKPMVANAPLKQTPRRTKGAAKADADSKAQ